MQKLIFSSIPLLFHTVANYFNPQKTKTILILLFGILFYSSHLLAQQEKTILSSQDLDNAIQLNKSKGFSPYYGMENEYRITTNIKKIHSEDSLQIAASLKNTQGVIDCNVVPNDHFIKVTSGKKISEDGKENKIASIEQIKAALVPFGIEINSYEEIVYKSEN